MWKKLKELFSRPVKKTSTTSISTPPKQYGDRSKFTPQHLRLSGANRILIVEAEDWDDEEAVRREVARMTLLVGTTQSFAIRTDNADEVTDMLKVDHFRFVFVFDKQKNSELIIDLIMRGVSFKHFQR